MCAQLRADVELSFFSIFCGKCSEGLNQTSTEEEEEEEEEAVREARSANPGPNIQIWSSVSTLGKKGGKKKTQLDAHSNTHPTKAPPSHTCTHSYMCTTPANKERVREEKRGRRREKHA